MQAGRVQLRLGQLAQAEANFQQALVAYEQAYGVNARQHVNTAAAHFAVGQVAMSNKDTEKAVYHYGQALAGRKAAYGCDHWEIALTLGRLANALFVAKQLEASEKLYNEERVMLQQIFATDPLNDRFRCE